MGLFKKKNVYKFTEPEKTACITCCHILSESRPVLYVTHDADDGTWQFLCGAEHHDESEARVAGLGQVIACDDSLNDLYEMPRGMGAQRSSQVDQWVPFRLKSEE